TLPLSRRVAGHSPEPVCFVEMLRRDHALARVEPHGARAARPRPVERECEQMLADPAAALARPQIHALELELARAEVAQRDRADHLGTAQRDPERGVGGAGIVEVSVELWVGLEAELTKRLGDERAKPV